ncbi:MAG: SagB/ThcOx family dehydrogenase [Bacteroidales bacterium]|nr:SagB/ThcOx family dehydrogenase [Bacteroidales bacterium]
MKFAISLVLLNIFMISFSQSDTLKLPNPQTTGGKPLMEALKDRQSQRNFDPKREISDQILSNLLWAANGINRPETGNRTAPSAVNWQEIDIYISLKTGTYKYLHKEHALLKINSKDLRNGIGKQEFTGIAPLNFVYVADYSRMGSATSSKEFYAATDCGFVAQNVYLFCASEGLATVVLGAIDREKICEMLDLNNNQHVVLCQTIGYPVEEFEEAE